MYLGVHWFSDVVGAFLFGAIFLLAVEWCFDYSHRRYHCAVFAEGEPEQLPDREEAGARR